MEGRVDPYFFSENAKGKLESLDLLYFKPEPIEVSLPNPHFLPNPSPLKSSLYTTDANRVSSVAEPRARHLASGDYFTLVNVG